MHTEIGASMKQRDPEGAYKEAILKMCPYYFDLLGGYFPAR